MCVYKHTPSACLTYITHTNIVIKLLQHLCPVPAPLGTVASDTGTVVRAVAIVAGGCPGESDHIDRDKDDEEQHGADDNGHVEADADAGVALLGGPSARQRHDSQDEGWDGAGEADERGTAADQREDGENESADGNSRVVFGRRSHVSGSRHRRLRRHHNGGVS